MTLIEDIQKEATRSDCDIVALLRKTLIASHKLQLKDLEDWINCELKGYKGNDKIPVYRESIYGQLKYFNPYNGWQFIMFENSEMQNMVSHIDIKDSITKLVDLCSRSNNSTFVINLPQEIVMMIWSGMDFGPCDTRLFIDNSVLFDIVEQVKNHILDWSMMLEDKGICGHGLSFSQEEKSIAQNTPSIVNYTNNFYSSSENIMIQQGTESSAENLHR